LLRDIERFSGAPSSRADAIFKIVESAPQPAGQGNRVPVTDQARSVRISHRVGPTLLGNSHGIAARTDATRAAAPEAAGEVRVSNSGVARTEVTRRGGLQRRDELLSDTPQILARLDA